MVHAAAHLVLLFGIGSFQDVTSSCSKLFEILLFLSSYTGLCAPKTRTFEKFGKKYALLSTLPNKRYCCILQFQLKFKNYQMKDRNWFMAGDPSVLVFVIGRVRDLASSCSKLFEISLFVMNYTLLPVPKLRTFENFGKK